MFAIQIKQLQVIGKWKCQMPKECPPQNIEWEESQPTFIEEKYNFFKKQSPFFTKNDWNCTVGRSLVEVSTQTSTLYRSSYQTSSPSRSFYQTSIEGRSLSRNFYQASTKLLPWGYKHHLFFGIFWFFQFFLFFYFFVEFFFKFHFKGLNSLVSVPLKVSSAQCPVQVSIPKVWMTCAIKAKSFVKTFLLGPSCQLLRLDRKLHTSATQEIILTGEIVLQWYSNNVGWMFDSKIWLRNEITGHRAQWSLRMAWADVKSKG